MTPETQQAPRRHRLVLDLPAELYYGLRRVADTNFRDGKREAIRLLSEGVERELDAHEATAKR